MDYTEDTLTGTAQAAYRMRLLSKNIGAAPVHSLRFLVIGNPEVTEVDKRVEEATVAVSLGGDTASQAALDDATRSAETVRARASGGIVEKLKANEMALAKTREKLHQSQEDAFAARVAKINNRSAFDDRWSTTSETAYDVTTDPDAILNDASGTSALATSTSTSVSKSVVSFRREPESVERIFSTWYRPTDTPTEIMVSWTGDPNIMDKLVAAIGKAAGLGLSGQQRMNHAQINTFGPFATNFFSASVNDGLIARFSARLSGVKEYAGYFPLLICIAPIFEASSGKVGHWTGYAPAPLKCFTRARERHGMNLQHLVFIAQDSALLSSKRDTKLTMNKAASREVPMDPPATASLHLVTGHDVQSNRLNEAIDAFSKAYGDLRLTTRMFLRHTRMTPAHCIVIVHGAGDEEFVLATCADLLLQEIRELHGARVYFHANGKVAIYDMDLQLKDEEPLDAALYLLASVGAIMSYDHQVKVQGVMETLDKGKRRGIITLACENSRATKSYTGASDSYPGGNPNRTAPSRSNEELREKLDLLMEQSQLNYTMFGRTSTRKQRYI
jgi:hypothetical protein